ncbi:hypothetical protein [Rhodoferax sp.]|uniref:hypothetical protein n=1 Tax=Rhodoferax sp. TaxID=50421 RepID=UPI0026014EAF|nr:hypothetical protein [Rhodoferax sp.]
MTSTNKPRHPNGEAPSTENTGGLKSQITSTRNFTQTELLPFPRGKQSLPTARIGKVACDAIRAEIARAGLRLNSAAGDSQMAMLPRVLRYLGARGLGTVEAEALGYRRIATRIQDLEERGYRVHVDREHVVTDDQLLHPRMARYKLMGAPRSAAKRIARNPAENRRHDLVTAMQSEAH